MPGTVVAMSSKYGSVELGMNGDKGPWSASGNELEMNSLCTFGLAFVCLGHDHGQAEL